MLKMTGFYAKLNCIVQNEMRVFREVKENIYDTGIHL